MLPIIDFQDFPAGSAARRCAVADEIAAACEAVGFFYLANHGVAQATVEAAFAALRGFCRLPEAEKLACARTPGHYRGYIPAMTFAEAAGGAGSDGPALDKPPPVRYEAFIVGSELAADDPAVAASRGLLWPNPWPAAQPAFRSAQSAYWDAVTALSADLLRAFALALGQPETALLRHFRQPLSNLSLLHYLPRPAGTGAQATRAHRDTNAVTILMPGAVGGLQVRHRTAGWIEAPPRAGCFVVNIGNMMTAWSGGRFRSTLHRVDPPAETDRYSLAYFATPDYETAIAPLPGIEALDGDNAPRHAGRELAAFVAQFDDSQTQT